MVRYPVPLALASPAENLPSGTRYAFEPKLSTGSSACPLSSAAGARADEFDLGVPVLLTTSTVDRNSGAAQPLGHGRLR